MLINYCYFMPPQKQLRHCVSQVKQELSRLESTNQYRNSSQYSQQIREMVSLQQAGGGSNKG